jgi:DnaJ family protein A protein 2
MSRGGKSLYDILGVKKTDSTSDIKRAYLKLARVHHPDKGGDAELFKEIGFAYEILTDDARRKVYDDTGLTDENALDNASMPNGFSFPFDMNINDLFGGMFGRSATTRKGKKDVPAVQNIPITLEQFYLGHKFDININRQAFCKLCEHSGAKSKEICKKCNGQGAVTQIVQMGPMTMHTTGPCLDCQGKGERIIEICSKCFGSGLVSETKKLTIKILPGTNAEETYIFPEVCSDNAAFERAGDAHIIIKEDQQDPAFKLFKRMVDSPQHLETHITLSLAESLIGCVVRIDGHPGYEDGLFIKIPPGSFENDRYCLAGFGMPIHTNVGKYGDLIMCIHVSVKAHERALFATSHNHLQSIFEGNVRKTVCEQNVIQTDLYLRKE